MGKRGEAYVRRRRAAIVALVTHNTISAAAKEVGVHRSTLGRWMQEPAFARDLKAAQTTALNEVVTKLRGAAGTAIDVLILKTSDPKFVQNVQNQQINLGTPYDALTASESQAIEAAAESMRNRLESLDTHELEALTSGNE
jgi:transposase-like protein